MSQEQYCDKDQAQSQTKRQYGCPCGKTYLSYPALFTHVKQKHDGKAPGTLIKPKTEKARGRPKLHVDAPQDDMSDGAFNLEQQLKQALDSIIINYSDTIKKSEGNRTCQDIASIFINKSLAFLTDQQVKILTCFFNEMKYFVEKKHGDKFWIEEKPSQIIQIVNDMYKGHEQIKKKFPIPKQTLLQVLYVFFRWMYKQKYTDHKLIKRSPVKILKQI